VATWPTPSLSNGTLVDDEDWNLHVSNLNDLDTRVNGIGGLVQTANSNIATLQTNQGTRGAQGPVYTELTSLKAVDTTQNTNITALQNAVGIPWSGGTALSRIQALEAAGGGATKASGQWQAPDTGAVAVSYGTSPTDTTLNMTKATKTPVGLTNSGGVVTIGAGNGGWYLAEFKYDVNMAATSTQRCDSTVASGGGTVLYGSAVAYYPAAGWSFHACQALVYLNAGDTIKCMAKYWTTSGSGTYSHVGQDRTWFKLTWLGS